MDIGMGQFEVAEKLGVSQSTVCSWIKKGLIPDGEIVIGKRRFWTTGQVETIKRWYSQEKDVRYKRGCE